MLEPKDENLKTLNLDFQLDDRQRGILASAIKQEFFDLIQHLMEDTVRHFNIALVNTDEADEKSVLARHKMAKMAAQFYTAFMTRIAEEVNLELYNAAKIGTPDHPERIPMGEEFE